MSFYNDLAKGLEEGYVIYTESKPGPPLTCTDAWFEKHADVRLCPDCPFAYDDGRRCKLDSWQEYNKIKPLLKKEYPELFI